MNSDFNNMLPDKQETKWGRPLKQKKEPKNTETDRVARSMGSTAGQTWQLVGIQEIVADGMNKNEPN